MNFRTDLALEMRESVESEKIDGVISSEENLGDIRITRIEITNENGVKTIGKPKGKYITIEVSPFSSDGEINDDRLTVLTSTIRELLPKEGPVLVAGLGNEEITPDALGPKCAKQIFVTRHIDKELAKSVGLEDFRQVSGIAPNVLGKTGIETSEILLSIIKHTKPIVLITIDALASRSISRLGNTIQITDTGISPGSGVGNRRNEISKAVLGIPVISIGVPTVVDAATLASDITGEDKEDIDETFLNMMVTPREIDLVIERSAKLVALAINCALQPKMQVEDILSII